MIKVTLLKSRISHRGGLEKATTHLARAFCQAGCQVTVLTTGPCSIEGVDVIEVAKSSKFSLYHLIHFDRMCQQWLQDHPQDVIFGMERNTHQTHYRAGSGCHAAYLKRRRLTDSWAKRLSFSLNPLHRTLLRYERKGFEDPVLKILFTNSEMVKSEILDHYQIPESKIQVVHNGVEWKEWEKTFQNSFSQPLSDHFEFLFVGNGYKRKGLAFLLEGLALLPKESFHLTVIGKEKNIPSFQKLAHKLGIEKAISFLGPQEDIRPYYQAADCVVIPSIYDPFANVTVEALAMGLFVISSRYNGGYEVLTPESGAIIEKLDDPGRVATALKQAMKFEKTQPRAQQIRDSIKQLDFSHQLDKIVQQTLNSL